MERRYNILVKLIISLFFMLGLMAYYHKHEPYPTGDGIEYILTTEAFKNHGSSDIRITDYESFKRDFLKHQTWQANYKAAAFDAVEGFLRNKNSKSFGGFYRNNKGDVYGYHFVFYALVNVPARELCALFGTHPIQAFTYTNIVLWSLFFWLVLYLDKISWWTKVTVFIALFLSGGIYYTTWSHPEVLTLVLLAISFLFLLRNNFSLSILLCALAALQNQPLVLLLPWIVFYAWTCKRSLFKEVLINLVLCTIVFLPAIYFYGLFGTTSLIKDAGFLSFSNISGNRLWGFFSDLNQGMIIGLGFTLLIYPPLLIYRFYKAIKEKELSPWDLLPLFVLSMVLVVCSMSNWNHGMAIVNRYSVWIAVPIIFHIAQLLQTIKSPLRFALLTLSFSGQIFLLRLHASYNLFDWSNLQHMPIAKWVLSNHPNWYNPDPQIFIARTNRVFDFSEKSSPVFFFDNQGKLKKIAVHENNIDTLKCFGYRNPEKQTFIMRRSGHEKWYYVNDFQEKTAFSTQRILGIIKDSEIKRTITEMQANPQWIAELTIKAKNNHISLEQQMRKDAEFLYNQNYGIK